MVERGPLNGNLSAQEQRQIEAQIRRAEEMAEAMRQQKMEEQARLKEQEAQNLRAWRP